MTPPRGKKASMAPEELKAEILKVARRHFALHGVQGASLKSIAQEVGVANSLINYHFKDKAGLLQASMEHFAASKQARIARILAEPKNKEELRVRLELFVDEMILSVMEDPEGFSIIEREITNQNPMILVLFQNTMLKGFQHVMHFFEQAQINGLVDPELEPMILAALLFSTTCDSSRKEVFAKAFFNVSFNEIEWRQRFTRHVVRLFLNGVVK